jgi:exportin-T
MTALIQQFEMSELADFLNFLGLLVHKLQTEMFGVLDELQTPLLEHVASIIAQTPNGREEKIAQTDTRKAYMTFLNNIVVSKLQGVFTSGSKLPTFHLVLHPVI